MKKSVEERDYAESSILIFKRFVSLAIEYREKHESAIGNSDGNIRSAFT
jgi:hypothetical protein